VRRQITIHSRQSGQVSESLLHFKYEQQVDNWYSSQSEIYSQ